MRDEVVRHPDARRRDLGAGEALVLGPRDLAHEALDDVRREHPFEGDAPVGHRGPLTAIAVEKNGHHMVTAGLDGQMKVWDIRTFKNVHNYFNRRPATTLDVSQRGLLAVGYGPTVEIWKGALIKHKKAKAPYMSHRVPGGSCKVRFRPYEDALIVGHAAGVDSLVIPGAGEPNFDSFEANPYATTKQRREMTVHSLLDKLQPEMITLDPSIIGNVDRAPAEVIQEERQLEREANEAARMAKKKKKKKTKGRNKIGKRLKKQQQNVITEGRQKLKQKLEQEKQRREESRRATRDEEMRNELGAALGIFTQSKRKPFS